MLIFRDLTDGPAFGGELILLVTLCMPTHTNTRTSMRGFWDSQASRSPPAMYALNMAPATSLRRTFTDALTTTHAYRPPPDPTIVCVNCVMDTSDTRIEFDSQGVCDHCRDFYENVLPGWHTDERGAAQRRRLAEKIRAASQGSDFDCVIGISGGLDSSYLVHIVTTEMGLRPLIFHVDGGWDTEIAVQNIERLVDGLALELYTEVINWEEMRDFQLAFFKAGVPHLDIPQDHAFIAALYNFCLKHRVRYILNGGNISTECVRNPLDWIYYGTDMLQIQDIRRRFATVSLTSYPLSGVLRHKLYLRYVRRIRVEKPLNYQPYTKKDAVELLGQKYGWRSYGEKHFESRFTRFYEGFWLPTRFGIDTRKVQYSSLILTGQMTRSAALHQLRQPPYSPDVMAEDFEYVATKLRISIEELNSYLHSQTKTHRDYRNIAWLFNIGAQVRRRLGLESSIKR